MKRKTIFEINNILSKLGKDKRDFVTSLYDFSLRVGKLKFSKDMDKDVLKSFKGKNVKNQKIVRVFNPYTFEETFFNELRALRPIQATENSKLQELINDKTKDPFCEPLKHTPEDVFGRLKGNKVVTASNVAKYTAHHGLIIFDKHNPLKLTKKDFLEAINLSLEWFREMNKKYRGAIYPLIMWNCLWKAGASINHSHFQLLLNDIRHFSKFEFLKRLNLLFEENFGINYFDAEFKAHKYLGLARQDSQVRIYAAVTPTKEKEVRVLLPNLNKSNVRKLFTIISKWKEKLLVESFNMIIALPPLKEVEGWNSFPVFVRIIDRDKLLTRTSDFGGLEVGANASVVATDPYKVYYSLK